MLFLILISISQNKKQERVYPKGSLWSINPKAIGNVFIVVVEMFVTQSFQWHPQNSKVLCSVSAPSLVWVSNKDGGASCPCSPQCMDSSHYLEDTEWCKVYLLEFINFIFFWYPRDRSSDFLSLGYVSKQRPLYSSFELEKLPKDLHRVVPCNHLGLAQMSVFWNAFSDYSSSRPTHVLTTRDTNEREQNTMWKKLRSKHGLD